MSKIAAPVSPIYRIPELNINKQQLVERGLERYQAFKLDRLDWIRRREEFYLGWDDYVTPIRSGPWDGSSTLHLPLTEIQCNAMHARILQAFFGLENWVFVDPQEELDIERIKKIELLMKYIVMRYANYNKGIYNAVDDWAWDLVTEGVGILSRDWTLDQRRYISIVENEDFKQNKLDLERALQEELELDEYKQILNASKKFPYKEQEMIRTIFNGPTVHAEDPNYVLFKGLVVDAMDLNRHETVIKVCYYSRDDLIGFAQSGFMDEDEVEKILAFPGNEIGDPELSGRQQLQDLATGIRTYHTTSNKDRYEFLLVYDTVPLERNGKKAKQTLADKVIYHIHRPSRTMPRWTFLDRAYSDGNYPFHMAHLYKRPRRSIGRGMVETFRPMNEGMDMLLNQGIDAGMLANQPMFGFRGNSTFDPKEVRIEPGLGLKMDDPNNDLRFFDWKTNPNWGQGFMGLLQSFTQQFSSIGPSSLGQVSAPVGPTRSTSGLNFLSAQTDIILDVILNRAKSAYSDLLFGLYMDCLDRMPDELMVTVGGSDGELTTEDGQVQQIKLTRKELRAKVHFGLYANSQALNRPAQEAAAMKMAQFLLQPIGLQTKVVTPGNVYEIYKDVVRTLGKQRTYRFLTKPADQIPLPLVDELKAILQGIKPVIVINDPEHQKKIQVMQQLLSADPSQLETQYGMIHPQALDILQVVINEHQLMVDTLAKPTNLENPTGAQIGIGGNPEGQEGGVPAPQESPIQALGGQQEPTNAGA